MTDSMVDLGGGPKEQEYGNVGREVRCGRWDSEGVTGRVQSLGNFTNACDTEQL